MHPASLSAQLRRRVMAVVAVLALLVSVGTVVAAGVIMHRQLGKRVGNTKAPQTRETGQQSGRLKGILASGTPPGTIVVPRNSSDVSVVLKIGRGEHNNISTEAIDALLKVNMDGRKRTVDIPELDQYRAVAQYNRNHEPMVSALPLKTVDITIVRLSLLAVALGVAAVVVAAFATRTVANIATKPLRSLSATASMVSQLDLDRGEVDVPAAPNPALPPEYEVMRLTGVFSRVLGNVQETLKTRQAPETRPRRFVASAFHELYNPLAAIRGYSELATHGNGAGSVFALGQVDSESQCMTKLVEDLLLLVRPDADAPVEMQPADIATVVLNTVSDARVAGPNHIWRLGLPEEGFEVRANIDRLHQMIVNLLSNAHDHIPAGTTITTVADIKDSQACLMVIDDGPSIAPDILP